MVIAGMSRKAFSAFIIFLLYSVCVVYTTQHHWMPCRYAIVCWLSWCFTSQPIVNAVGACAMHREQHQAASNRDIFHKQNCLHWVIKVIVKDPGGDNRKQGQNNG